MVWGDQSKYTSRVALVPFAPAVNVGAYFTKITGMSDREDNDGSSSKNIHYPTTCFSGGKLKSSCTSSTGQKTYNKVKYIAKYAPCVVEREGAGVLVLGQYTDGGSGPTAQLLSACLECRAEQGQ